MKVLVFVAVLLAPTPALAYQTEADPGELHDKRTDAIEREARRDRQAARERQEEARSTVEAPESVPAPTYPAGVLTADQVASYARGAGFPEDVIPTMVQIAARESGFNPAAVNPSSGACGLWQMYPCPGPHALDPATNAAMAFSKYQASGLTPWGFG